MKIIDIRSDTVTKPSKEMLSAMMNAPVGDDGYNEDPTVIKLEQMMAERAGMEAGLFTPSGTQSNLAAVMSHCQRGDEYIVGQTAHTYVWEGGGAAVLGSIQPQPLDLEEDGTLPLEKVDMVIKPLYDHHVRTKLLCLENTTNGKVLPINYLKDAHNFCNEKGLSSHLDGARVYNAAVHLGLELHDISKYFDSIAICLSKGLGAPVGSVLCGNSEFIKEAKRWRRVLGGSMRQSGIVAAAGIYALENNISRLSQDHENAQILAKGISDIEEMVLEENSLHTNMFFIKAPIRYTELREHVKQKGIILPNPFNKQGTIRFVTHMDVSRDDMNFVIDEIKSFYKKA